MPGIKNHNRNGSRIEGSVLVVDDNPANLHLLSGMLTDKGYNVRPAPNGPLALQSVQSILPDLILLDIKMPEMDGYEVCRRLKADEKTRHVPVLFISALAEMADKIKGFGVGAVDYITKPFQHEEVLARVNTHVSLARIHQRLEQMVKARTLALTVANEQLKHEIKERKLAQARERHLNQVLRAVRNVNQLIVQEKNRDRLLEKACAILVETPFYSHAWIILTDASGKPTVTAQAGLGERFAELVRQIEHGDPPDSVRKAMAQPDGLFLKNADPTCADCPLPDECHDRGSVVVRLEHGGKVFGVLTVAFPMGLVLDEEEISLIRELAGDIAFALFNYEQEKRKARAEKALHESEARFRELADSLPQIVFEMDETGLVTFVNRNAFDVFGFIRSDFDKGLNAFDMLIPEDHDRALKHMEREFKGDSPGGSEYTAVRKNGVTFPVVVHTNRVVRDSKPVGLRGIMIDLTERKKMEADLTRRAMAMDQATDAIVITDPGGTISYVNPAFEKSTGYTRKEAIGENPRILKSGKQDKAFYQHLWQTLSGGKTWSGRFINKKKNGSHYTEEATISPVFSPSGEIVNYVAVKRDITDKIDLENQLRQAQKMEAIGTLAGGIAHDFNNILSAIIGYTDLVLQTVAIDEKVRRHLEKVLQSGYRARDLVQQILTFSRRSEKKRVKTRIAPIVKEALKLLRATLPSTIQIHAHLESEDDRSLADPVQIHQVLMNLCTNAKHAMRAQGGVLEVKLTVVTLKPDNPFQLPPGRYLKLTVSDTGDGIPADVREKIFDPYFTTKAKGEGTGLGLSVVHGIVKDHGGGIHLISEKGKGARFNIFLPALERRNRA